MRCRDKLWIVANLARRRPRDIIPLVRDRQILNGLRSKTRGSEPVQAHLSRVVLNVPTHTDLHQVREVWVDQTYAGLDDFVPRPGWTVIDVGANIGAYSLWAGIHMGRGQIWAFEPVPHTFGYLQLNIYRNYRSFPSLDVIIHQCALAEADRALPMVTSAQSTGWSRLVGEEEKVAHKEKVIFVEAKPLDALVSDIRVDLMKIDVEGAELRVLQGSKRVLSRARRVVMEYHSFALRDECRAFLESLGFSIYLQTPQSSIGVAYFVRRA